jgi:hypothetical protein
MCPALHDPASLQHDDVDDLAARADEIVANDLNSIRLRR